MTDLIDHHGEIRRREHYQGIALLAAQKKTPTSQVGANNKTKGNTAMIHESGIVTAGRADASDADIMELLLSDAAVQK